MLFLSVFSISSFIPTPFACSILHLFRDEPGTFRFEAEPAPAVRERRHSHISGSDRESPLAMTGGEMESGLWWASLFLRNALAEGHALTGINR